MEAAIARILIEKRQKDGHNDKTDKAIFNPSIEKLPIVFGVTAGLKEFQECIAKLVINMDPDQWKFEGGGWVSKYQTAVEKEIKQKKKEKKGFQVKTENKDEIKAKLKKKISSKQQNLDGEKNIMGTEYRYCIYGLSNFCFYRK